jgi:hypothetical protein
MSTLKLKGSSSGEAEVTVAAAAGTPTITLPTASINLATAGSDGQFLKTNGSGTLSFATPSGGKITRVIQSLKADTESEAGTQYVFADIDGTDHDGSGSKWQLSITPASATHKILLHYEATFGQTGQIYSGFRLRKTQGGATTTVAGGSGSIGNRQGGIVGMYRHTYFTYGQDKVSGTILDSPGVATEVVYFMQMFTGNTSYPIYLNRDASDADDTYTIRSVSNLVAMEIAP